MSADRQLERKLLRAAPTNLDTMTVLAASILVTAAIGGAGTQKAEITVFLAVPVVCGAALSGTTDAFVGG